MGVLVNSFRDRSSVGAGALDRARQGDFEAYERLYNRHLSRVYALCLRMTANVSIAEEMTQRAFIRAWQRLDTLRGDNHFGAWLRRIAVNEVLADRRARSRRPEQQIEDLPAASAGSTVSAVPPDGGIDLERAIAGLPSRAREVFLLHDVEGYRHEEIAALLDIAAGTAKSQLHRARKLLREALNR